MAKNDATSFKLSPLVRPRLCQGSLLDIPAGRYHRGAYGDQLLSGGYSSFQGVGGRGNVFKTTMLISLMIRVLSRYSIPASLLKDPSTGNVSLFIYDTEVTFDWNRVFDIMSVYTNLDYLDLLELGRLVVTSSGDHMGNEWWQIVRNRANLRAKDSKRLSVESPFLDFHGNPIMVLPMESHLCDSMSQLSTDMIEEMYNKNEIDDSGLTTDHLRSGGIKTRLVMQIPNVVSSGGMTMACTAHVGNEFKLEKYAPSKQQLGAMPRDLEFKNVPSKFTFLSSNTWFIKKASPLSHDTTKASFYPLEGMNTQAGDVDLQILDVLNVRSKSGQTGHQLELIVSQDFGLLPGLSEFHFLNTRKDGFGMTAPEGQQRTKRLQLLEDVLPVRTKVRTMINQDYKLQRALEITSEMAQIMDYWNDFPRSKIMEPAEVKAKLIEKGYNWDLLLETRGYWTYFNYAKEHERRPLSTMDIINMVHDEYIPWWYPDRDSLKHKVDLPPPPKWVSNAK